MVEPGSAPKGAPVRSGIYIAVIGDVVGSRSVSDRAEFQQQLAAAIDSVNRRFPETVAARFVLTVGDEFQGLLASTDNIVRILASLRSMVHPVELRFGLGVGPLATPLRPEALGMDGPCFQLARIGIERAEQRETPVEVEANVLAEPFTIYALLFGALRRLWTEKQRQVIDLAMTGREGKEIASQLSISPPAVTQHLQAASWNQLEEATRSWEQALASVHRQAS